MFTVNWSTKVIFIPKADLTLLSSIPERYSLDVVEFWAEIHTIQSNMGITYDPIMSSNAPVTLSGQTYVRTVEVINNYKIEAESGAYSIYLTNANNNLLDVKVENQVSWNASNSAGAVLVDGGSGGGGSPADTAAIALAVKAALQSDLTVIKDHARAANMQTQLVR